jgi:phage terminase large subunit
VILDIPDAFKFLYLESARYKVVYGGRGSGKSTAIAKTLLLNGMQQKLRILCTREVQKSIKDSVHRLLSDLISADKELQQHYDVLETIVRGRNGTEFLFAGLSGQTIDSIKSFEGVDRCWTEEAQTVVKRSWDILIPTIRKDDSEIWASFNPILDTDEAYRRFVLNPPPNAIIKEVNYLDNPWFPAVLEQERLHCLATETMEDYNNIWLGQCRSAVEGAIYSNELAESLRKGRICNCPYDPMLKVHAVWDMGWNDLMAIILVQRLRSEIRIIGYLERQFKRVDECAGELKAMNYNWGYDFLPHDGNATSRQTGKTDKQILEAMGRKVKITPSMEVEAGIRQVRTAFPQMYFDRTEGGPLIERLRRYCRTVNKQTGAVGLPVQNEATHGSDCLRYVALNIKHMSNEDEFTQVQVPDYIRRQQFTPSVGSMGM